jgi:hypothetical protein
MFQNYCWPLRLCTVVLSIWMAAGCVESSGTVAVEELPDLVDGGLELPLEVAFELEESRVLWDIAVPDAPETDSGLEPEPGAPGNPCETNDECNSGFCILTPDGRQCTMQCLDECPFGWQCVVHKPSLPDEVYICAPASMNLCRPCNINDDCLVNGADTGDRCLVYGAAGSFCGAECAAGGGCSEGFACQSASDVTGAQVEQCVLLEGECDCAQSFADDGAWTNCHVENDFGLCLGQRLCTGTGLSICDASVPASEVCNLEDDDCDGEVDEETGGEGCNNINSWGTCSGVDACEDGELVCEGEFAAAELCNGEDDDCDGESDEGFPDTDKDGVADCLEGDKDGDGVADSEDNCPFDHNPVQSDFDLDTLGDSCDPDDDNDLWADDVDCAPTDPASHPEGEEICDGKDNDCNGVVDQGFSDTDTDGIKNCIDSDDDNDTFVDEVDCAALDAAIFPGAPEKCDGIDNDCDNQTDEDFADLDGDGEADCIDSDLDGDGVDDSIDNCPKSVNPEQEDLDEDGFGDACDPDDDGDGIPDQLDNCLMLFNPGQQDTDGDGAGDACDDDSDGDTIIDGEDNCPAVKNAEQEDFDEDGLGNACDLDDDGDGDPDLADCQPLDGAIYHGAQELCNGQDDNCVFGEDEGFNDADLDGLKNCIDSDDDNDGDPDLTDCAPLDGSVGANAVEVCDSKDNDCDGKVDEALGEVQCGKGLCAHSQNKCVDGNQVVCDPWEGAQIETCNGQDDDCDGLTDEDQGSSTCGLGSCLHNVANCADGEVVPCDPLAGAGEEFCDGLDNDCDGKTDEEQPLLACGKGLCFHTIASCLGGVEQQCDPFQGAKPESCNNIDDDCDGEDDEDLGVTTCGLGECLHEVQNCVAGQPQVCNPFTGALAEACDSLDNDCNGIVDEDLGVVSCGQGACEHIQPLCKEGVPQDCDPFAGAGEETCDGEDNDCDGEIDEEMDTVTCGKGICEVTVEACADGVPQECVPGEEGDETCNGLDDDCNGVVDDGFEDFDQDGLSDCIDADDDNDQDPDVTDCAPLDAALSSLSGVSCTLLVTNSGGDVLVDHPLSVALTDFVAEYGSKFAVLKADGEALPYCFEQSNGECAAAPATGAIWIAVDSLPAVDSVTLKLEVRPASLAQAGGDVFDLYDDFAGPGIDANRWTTDTTNCNPTVSGGWLNSSAEKGSNSHCGVLAKSFAVADNMRFTARVKIGNSGGSDCDPGVLLTSSEFPQQDNAWIQTHSAGWASDDESNVQYMIHYSTSMETMANSGIRGQTFLVHVTVSGGKVRNCQSLGDKCSAEYTYNSNYPYPFVGALWYQSIPWSYDWIHVRKFANPAPTTAWQ